MTRQEKWDQRYLSIAQEVSQWSKDPSTKVGAVLVRGDNLIVSTGYNGFPSGHDDSKELYDDRNYKYANIVHAETNAIRNRNHLYGYTLYTTFPPCPDCMQRIGDRGIGRVVSMPVDFDGKSREWVSFWRGQLQVSEGLAETLGVKLELVGE